MKSLTWIALFFLLVFGIGWTSRLLAERPAENPERGPEQAWPDSRSHSRPHSRPHARRGYGPGGPFISTIEQFSDELALSEEQRAELDAIMAQTVEQVEEHEQAIRDLMRESRPRVLAILTDAQRDALDGRIAERRRQYAGDRRRRKLDWLRANTSLDDPALLRLEAVLTRYSEAKTQLFEGFSGRSAWPGDDELRQAIKQLRSERDAGLSIDLDAETLREFQSNTDHRYHTRQ